ncbi:MAG: TetR/AcrR family transcriptional regulator [Myxococcota bacterium]|nr:TetR/AcrR family transcriptional regulator [Myxococcota bacterium]
MSRGQQTREEILNEALDQATKKGLEALSIGTLAKAVGMSKSGLFGHFGSKENLQTSVLEVCSVRFIDAVVRPAIKLPRGIARLRSMLDLWLAWAGRDDGGCLFVSTAAEFDDRPGPVQDEVARQVRDWLTTLERATAISIAAGDLREDTDPEQFAFELHGLMLSYHLRARLLGSDVAEQRARVGLERLIRDYSVSPEIAA